VADETGKRLVLVQRVITAFVLVAGFLFVLFGLSPTGFTAVMGLVISYAAWEWSAVAGLLASYIRFMFVAALMLIMIMLYQWLHIDEQSLQDNRIRQILRWTCVWWAIALLWIQSYPSSALLWGRPWSCAVMGVLVLVPAWLALGTLVHATGGVWLVLVVVGLVAAADIGAFFTGRAVGRHKLARRVSPGKTWEGFAGGLFGVMLVITPFALYQTSGKLWGWLLLAGATGIASVIGDLLESMVKRQRGIKDSGNILPGHGGILDRIDSLTAALPTFTLLYALLYTQLY
jgi:phosphatidate cytidylyltransferase